MKQALIKHIESLDLYSYTISKFEVEIKRFIAQIEDSYSEDERVQFEDLPFLDCKLQTKKRNPKKFKDIYAAADVSTRKKDQARPVLAGYEIHPENKTIASTDGRRLSVMEYAGSLEPNIYIKYKNNHLKNLSYAEYKDLQENKPELLQDWLIRDDLLHDNGNFFAIPSGTFPNYFSVIPESKSFTFQIKDIEQLYCSVRAAMQYYRLSSQNQTSNIPAVRINTNDKSIILNVNMLCDGLELMYYANNNSFSNIVVDCISSTAPVQISIPGTKNLYVFMPCTPDDEANILTVSNFQPVESSPGRKKKRTVKKQVKKVKPESVESLESVETVNPEPVPESVDIEPVQPVERDLSAFAGIEDYLNGLTRKQRKNLEFVQRFDFNGSITTEKRIAFINRMHLQGLLTATVRESSSKVHYLVCGQYVGENTYCYARFLLQAAESKQEISA